MLKLDLNLIQLLAKNNLSLTKATGAMEKTVIHPCSFGFSRKGRECDPHWEFRALANLVRQINVSLVDI
jgi:hypothetical protein